MRVFECALFWNGFGRGMNVTCEEEPEFQLCIPKGSVELKLHHKFRGVTSMPIHIEVQ